MPRRRSSKAGPTWRIGPTCCAQPHPSAVALEQGGAQALLELADRMTDRAGRKVQFRGSLIERPGHGRRPRTHGAGTGTAAYHDELDSRVVVKIAFARTTDKADHPGQQNQKNEVWEGSGATATAKRRSFRAQPAEGGSAWQRQNCFASQGARVAILDLDLSAAHEAATSLGEGHLGLPVMSRTPRPATVPPPRCIEKFGSHRYPRQQCRHHPAREIPGDRCQELERILDVNLKGVLLAQPGRDPEHEKPRRRFHRVHVVGFRPAWRRHLRRAALLSRQGRRAGPRQGHGP